MLVFPLSFIGIIGIYSYLQLPFYLVLDVLVDPSRLEISIARRTTSSIRGTSGNGFVADE